MKDFSKKMHHSIDGITIKKKFGQHFLRWNSVTNAMIEQVSFRNDSSVLEIGCGDGFLTRAILAQELARLWVFEIDPEWAEYIKKTIQDARLSIFTENILDINFDLLNPFKPWILLSNLPYQITFPILYVIQRKRHFFSEGVIMVQEEVAQKIVKTSGRGYGYPSLFFQYFFEWKMLMKIPPAAFVPPPKVNSRLLYFRPKENVELISNEEEFWKFIKACFKSPRRTLKNNLSQTHFEWYKINENILQLRAQQLSMNDFRNLWQTLGDSV